MGAHDDAAGAASAGVRATLAWGMLLHDVGKPATFQPPASRRPGDRIRFNGHVEVGVADRGGDPGAAALLERGCGADRRAGEEPHAVRRRDEDERVDAEAVSCGCRGSTNTSRCTGWTACVRTGSWGCTSLRSGSTRATPAGGDAAEAAGDGTRLDRAGYRPGPQFKAMLEAAEDAQLEGRVKTPEEGLALVRERFGRRRRTRGGCRRSERVWGLWDWMWW